MITRITETTLFLPEMSRSFTGASLQIKPHAFSLMLNGTSVRPEAIRVFQRRELEALVGLMTAALNEVAEPRFWVDVNTGETGKLP